MRPARAAFERALQSAKDALKIASPLEVGIFGRGKSLNPRCDKGMEVNDHEFMDGDMDESWADAMIQGAISSCWVELEKKRTKPMNSKKDC